MRTLALICLCFAAAIVSISPLPLLGGSTDSNETRATGKVKFYLYTKSNPTIPEELFIDDVESVKKSHFDNGRQTKVLIHGFNGSYLSTLNPTVREAYFSQPADYNIISVDWNEYAKLNYVSSVYNVPVVNENVAKFFSIIQSYSFSIKKVPVVGEDVAEFVDFLHRKFKLNFDKLVVIGHSLGAHVAGFCGKKVKEGKIGGIVGLDPALPSYSNKDSEERLARTDAKYVQTIHTDGGVYGFLKPIGNASFYANWGRSQPGCGFNESVRCSHERSIDLYAEAVRNFSYAPVYKCADFEDIVKKSGCSVVDDNAKIGDPLQVPQVEGIFYFKTNDKVPFGHVEKSSFY